MPPLLLVPLLVLALIILIFVAPHDRAAARLLPVGRCQAATGPQSLTGASLAYQDPRRARRCRSCRRPLLLLLLLVLLIVLDYSDLILGLCPDIGRREGRSWEGCTCAFVDHTLSMPLLQRCVQAPCPPPPSLLIVWASQHTVNSASSVSCTLTVSWMLFTTASSWSLHKERRKEGRTWWALWTEGVNGAMWMLGAPSARGREGEVGSELKIRRSQQPGNIKYGRCGMQDAADFPLTVNAAPRQVLISPRTPCTLEGELLSSYA